jgi:hypothetical protein
MTHLYNGLIDRIAKTFDAAFSAIEAGYGFDYGDELEVALCRTLSRILPARFSVCRGFVVNIAGEKAGDDIIIYERHLFPTARFLLDGDFSLKEQVPIEAVAAYIEAKHTLELEGDSNSSLDHALSQAGKVKQLCDRREAVPLRQIARNVVIDGLDMKAPTGYPDKRNPMYTAIISRHVRRKPSKPNLTDSSEIDTALATRGAVAGVPPPDLVVAGPSNLALPCVPDGKGGKIIHAPFVLPNGGILATMKADQLAFGLGLCHLLWALDFITLGSVPWSVVLQDALDIPSTPKT